MLLLSIIASTSNAYFLPLELHLFPNTTYPSAPFTFDHWILLLVALEIFTLAFNSPNMALLESSAVPLGSAGLSATMLSAVGTVGTVGVVGVCVFPVLPVFPSVDG